MNDFNKISSLQERNYELQRQLVDINNASVKKFTKKAPELPIVEMKKTKLMTGTPKAIADIATRDLAFQVQLDDLAEKAVVQNKDILPTKVNREITPEMIADFEDAKKTPIEIAGQTFSYNPSALTIDLEDYTPIHIIADYKDIEEIKRVVDPIKSQLVNDYEQLKKNVADFKLISKKIDDDYNVEKSKLIQEIKKKRGKNRVPIADNINALEEKHKADIAQLKAELLQMRNEMANIEGNLKQLDKDVKDEIQKFEDNQAELDRVERNNKGALGAYIQDIQALNVGLNISRNIGETDAEFATRLAGLSQPLISSGEEEEAIKRKQFLRMKSLLTKLTTDGSKAENATKLLTPVEQFEYIKREPVINKKFLEVYGFNNKRVTSEDIATFIKNLIVENPTSLVSTVNPSKKLTIEPEKPETIAGDTGKKKLINLLKSNGINKVADVDGDVMIDTLNISELLNVCDNMAISIPSDVIDALRKNSDKLQAQLINKKYSGGPGGVATGPLAAAEPDLFTGIGVKQYPKLVKFGKIYISADELYYKNVLKIRNYKKRAIVGIPNVKVSEDLATILLKIIDGGKVSKSNLNLLSKKERHIYDQICIMSGLHKTHDNTFDTTAQELKQQLEVAEGEVFAGNNNPELLKEIHRLLWTMNSVGLISGKVALEHFKDIKRIYF
jgi:hypothetical protein